MLTEDEAFEAMRYFLTEFWKRGGSHADSDLVDILDWTGREDWPDGTTTNDPAQRDYWESAVRAVQSGERASLVTVASA